MDTKLIRKNALLDAIKDICPTCGARVNPDDHDRHKIHGPNEAGDYTHHVSPNIEELCPASSVWARVNYEGAAQ